MKYIIEVETHNSAFYDEEGHFAPHQELSRILKELAENNAPSCQSIKDTNGNKVGFSSFISTTGRSREQQDPEFIKTCLDNIRGI